MNMKGMEIERKFLIDQLPRGLEAYRHRKMEQGYLSTDPVLRVRREDDEYFVTYKSRGLMSREEYNLPLTAEAYYHLIQKADGIIITKTRYYIPQASGLVIELDVFSGEYDGLVMAEVEFDSIAAANAYTPPDWFGTEVTNDPAYHNSSMSRKRLAMEVENE